ncbi:cell division protein FtsW [Faunimonas pinastri]|uniref:Probable peptidoglycan glycosyltransferase FtsW n=1 Tax=Faunimonas pinastri TaxID=1855383 RepID=A0A1H9FSK8_9HYPH|nr:putative peptidoglycan glycosyltransferase FtsW [Faunimonas pinastri]SEQ40458.1 cell division protein FtsW [Faunimonas pinastri]
MISRANRSPLAEWWWTIDRTLLSLVLIMLLGGVVLSLAASPAVAERIGLEPLHFFYRQALFAPVSAAIMIGISFLTPRQIRRAALIVLVLGLGMMVGVLLFGAEVKGSRRWFSVAGLSVQPSEFVKPAFIVISAWLFGEGNRPDIPGRLLAVGLLVVVLALLVAEPDLGQTMLTTACWGTLLFLAGVSPMLVVGLGVLSGGGLAAAYFVFPHVAARIDRFRDHSSGDTFQIDTALQSFRFGGWSGTGPGEGVMKRVLPDAHTDFVFSVVGEEFGIILCLIIVSLFLILVLRGMSQALKRNSAFERMAIAGLVTQIGMQAFINMGVNLQLLPAKGMTLPFISYGGSTLIATALTTGFLLALSRRSVSQQNTIVPRPHSAMVAA